MKTQRSPEGIGRAERGGVEEMLGRWKQEMGEVMRDLKSMKRWKVELRQMKEEVREQGRLWKREIEDL